MAKRTILNKALIGVIITLFASTLLAQKPRTVTGTLIDDGGNAIRGITVLLLHNDGTEAQRNETSKKGAFKFKKVAPGNYTLEADGADAGKVSSPVEVSNKNVKLGDLSLSIEKTKAPPETIAVPKQESKPDPVAFQPDAGKDYILNS